MSFTCLACFAPTAPWFQKTFPDREIPIVDYWKCPACGFVAAKTISELSEATWGAVNARFHNAYQGGHHDPNDPAWLGRLAAQADVIADLAAAHLIPTSRPWLDYGCGDGKLSALLAGRAPQLLQNFEPHRTSAGYLGRNVLQKGAFSMVITTSVFEHLRTRAQLDEIVELIADRGVMGLHTVVAEEIPGDPNWFYYLPVHCSFFTNASMRALFAAWGFHSSVYHVASRLWLCFKDDPALVERTVATLNTRPGVHQNAYHFKSGFMDYWRLTSKEVMRRRSFAT